jgi:hypothetical protein
MSWLSSWFRRTPRVAPEPEVPVQQRESLREQVELAEPEPSRRERVFTKWERGPVFFKTVKPLIKQGLNGKNKWEKIVIPPGTLCGGDGISRYDKANEKGKSIKLSCKLYGNWSQKLSSRWYDAIDVDEDDMSMGSMYAIEPYKNTINPGRRAFRCISSSNPSFFLGSVGSTVTTRERNEYRPKMHEDDVDEIPVIVTDPPGTIYTSNDVIRQYMPGISNFFDPEGTSISSQVPPETTLIIDQSREDIFNILENVITNPEHGDWVEVINNSVITPEYEEFAKTAGPKVNEEEVEAAAQAAEANAEAEAQARARANAEARGRATPNAAEPRPTFWQKMTRRARNTAEKLKWALNTGGGKRKTHKRRLRHYSRRNKIRFSR